MIKRTERWFLLIRIRIALRERLLRGENAGLVDTNILAILRRKWFMRGNGLMIWKMGKGSLIIIIMRFTQDSEKMTNGMESVNTSMRIILNMKEIGPMIKNKDRVSNFFQMETNTRENELTGRWTDREDINLIMGICLRELFRMGNSKGLVFIIFQMVIAKRVFGVIINLSIKSKNYINNI